MPRFLLWLRDEVGFYLRLLRWRAIWVVALVTVAASVAAYQRPGKYEIDVGSRQDQAYTRNFHTRLEESGRTYRWSDVYGYVIFPGVGGSRPFTLTVALDSQRPAPLEVHVNGKKFFAAHVEPGWRTLSFKIDESHPAALSSRDTVVEFRAPEYRLPGEEAEAKGLKVDTVILEQAPAGGFIWPSLATVGLIVLSTLLVYALLGRALLGLADVRAVRVRSALASLLAGAGFCLLLATNRTAISAAAPHVAATLGSALVMLVATEGIAGKLYKGIGSQGARLLSIAVGVAFGVRYGGMALPQSVIIDMPYHMKWLRTLLAGNWQALYFPGGLSEVPPEWGMSLLIPKSPLFYIAVTPFSTLPIDIETLTKWLICFLDASVVLFVYWFSRRVGASQQAAIAGAFLYAFMPLAFRALSYGILPTIFAQWLAVGLFAFVLARHERGWRPASLALGAVLATVALLSFPTVALFVTLVIASVPLAWRLVRPRRRLTHPDSWQLYAMLTAAWLLAIAAYYGLYIEPVAASAQALLAPTTGGGATVKWPGGVVELVAWTADYLASTLPVLLAAVGVLLLIMRAKANVTQVRATALILIWLAIMPVFVAANYRIDMIGKHLFFTMLPVAVCGGVGLMALRSRGAWGPRLSALVLSLAAWQALVFWVDRLVRAST